MNPYFCCLFVCLNAYAMPKLLIELGYGSEVGRCVCVCVCLSVCMSSTVCRNTNFPQPGIRNQESESGIGNQEPSRTNM